jgi:hypothetical protein
MTHRYILIAAWLLASLLALPARGQQAETGASVAAYREPLAALADSTVAVVQSVEAPAALPVFAVDPAHGRPFAHEAMAFVSRALVSAAAERTGVHTPVASPTYQPYRPGVSVPEPATMERNCPPIGSLNPSAACPDR